MSRSISSSASRLDQVAREPVEHEAVAGVGLGQPLADQRDRQFVGDELAAASIGSTCLPSGVPAAIAARNMSPVAMWGISYFGGDPLCLRPLAGTLRAEDEQVHRRKPS